MDQSTRRIIGIGVTAGVMDGVSLCCKFNRIISSNAKPQRLISEKDPLLRDQQWQTNPWILDVEEIKRILYSLTSHQFVERLTGTIWREFRDRLLLL